METNNQNSENPSQRQPSTAPSLNSQNKLGGGFVQKPVNQPLLNSDTRDRLSGNNPASMSVQQKTFYQANKLYIWAGFFGLALIVILSYFAFRKVPAPLQAAKINVSIDAPNAVASGGDEVYKITVTNQDSQTLTGMNLELVYPDGVAYESSSPNAQNLEGSDFQVPDLGSGQNAVIIVKAKITGNVNDSKDLIAKLTYKYINSNSQFEKDADFSVRLAASDLAFNLTGPSQANNGQLVEYTLTYQNNSDQSIANGQVQVTYPPGFTFAQSSPQPDLGNNTWNVAALATGGQGTIQIQGTFSAAPGATVNAQAQFLIMGSDSQYYTQNSATFATTISNQPLLAQQTLQTNSASSTVVNPGDSLNYTIGYQNNASVAANGVIIEVTLDGNAVDLSSIQAEGGQVNNNTITWNAASVPNLQVLNPNEKGSVQFSARIKNPAAKDSSTNLTVVSHVKIISNEYATYYPGNDVTVKISSPSSITATAAYLSGALPPEVGKNTTYKVTITLRNATNDYSNTLMTAFIPLAAGSFDQTSVSPTEKNNVNFDASTGRLTWNVGQLPAHTGQFIPFRTLSFNINLNPSSSQVNTTPTLIKTVALGATDIFTGQSVQDTAPDITTASGSYQNAEVIP